MEPRPISRSPRRSSMPRKRPQLSYPELEHRGRGAILRSAEEVQAEQGRMPADEPDGPPAAPAASKAVKRGSPTPAYPYTPEVLQTVRRAVKQLGKEAAIYRFTQDEKKALREIVYTYRERGVKTSENEIT